MIAIAAKTIVMLTPYRAISRQEMFAFLLDTQMQKNNSLVRHWLLTLLAKEPMLDWWRKHMHIALRLIVILFLAFGASSASPAEVDVKSFTLPNGMGSMLVNITGVISGNELQTLKRQIDVKGRPYVSVMISSPGGDWDSSIALGRFLRKIEASVTVTGSCYSSCVLVLAAGVRRSIAMGPVGIHRPYSTDITPRTFLEAQLRYRAIEAETKKYLLDMNMPEALFEAMVRVPPESIRELTAIELERFGLSQDDPAAQEVDDANAARQYGLTMNEYLHRKARREKVCLAPANEEVLNPMITDDKRKELIDSWYACREAVMQGVK